jgi:hypothetical protein
MRRLLQHGRIAILTLVALLGFAAGPRSAEVQGKPGRPIDLNGSGSELQPTTGEDEHNLSVSGFGVGGYTHEGKTHNNSLAAGKVAVALFRELTDNLYVFGQLTTSSPTRPSPARSRPPRSRSTTCS